MRRNETSSTGKEEFERHTKEILFRIKTQFHLDPAKFTIPVYSQHEQVLDLRPVPAKLIGPAASDARLITEWRNSFRANFLTWFTATEKRTTTWLLEQVIAREDRILFMVQTKDGIPFGHMGLTNFDYGERLCEYDNIVRGRPLGPSGGMTLAGRALLNWTLKELKVEKVIVRVLSHNTQAIRLYGRCGFFPVKKVGLRGNVVQGEIGWTEDTKLPLETSPRTLTYMDLDTRVLQAEEKPSSSESGKYSVQAE